MASATPFGGGNQPIFQKYLAGYGPGSPFMPARIYGNAGGAMGPVGGAGAGSIPGTYNPASGGIPRTPTPSESLANLIAGISGNIGGLSDIISGVTAASNKALRDEYPASYFDTLDTLMGNVAKRAKGDITDLLPQLGQIGAEWGIGRGVAGGPAAASKLARDVLGSSYAVEQQALKDQGLIQDLIPKVAPYSADRLLPTFGDQISWEDLANVRGSAPIPESAYARALANARAGIGRGFNAGGGGFNWFNPMGRPTSMATGPTRPTEFGFNNPGRPNPTNPGQVPYPFPQGGMPPNVANWPGAGGEGVPFEGGPAYFDTVPNLWDTPFDMPQDFGGWDFDEMDF